MALGDGPTAFAGNMALGAVDDADLAERVGEAIGREARAMGVNVVYAPVLDVATEPGQRRRIGIRSFGDDPAAVGRLGAAIVRGLQRGRRGRRGQALPGSRRRRPRTRITALGGRPRRRASGSRPCELRAVPGGDRGRGPAGDVRPTSPCPR